MPVLAYSAVVATATKAGRSSKLLATEDGYPCFLYLVACECYYEFMTYSLPVEITNIMQSLQETGFEAYAVGGAVRDLLLNKKPQDWDVATNAKPEEIQKVFPDSVYENRFGTVGVKIRPAGSPDRPATQGGTPSAPSEQPPDAARADLATPTQIIEVTTYRIEAKYTDKRHPDEVQFTQDIKEDLARRDFTVNALALSQDGEILDLYDGQVDLEKKLIRAVGDAKKRFDEDALRKVEKQHKPVREGKSTREFRKGLREFFGALCNALHEVYGKCTLDQMRFIR